MDSNSKLNLGNNDLDIHNGNLSAVTALLRQGFNSATNSWNGPGGITSTSAAADSLHLTALGVISNSGALYGSGSPLGLFDGISPATTDILVKYTYYGDTNLDGTVDGSDYSESTTDLSATPPAGLTVISITMVSSTAATTH